MTPVIKNYLGVGLVGLAIIIFWVFIMPAWNHVSLLKDAITERETIWSSRSEILGRIDSLNKQYKERAADVNKISAVVPSTKSLAELVSTIETVSKQSGLQLIEMTTGELKNQQKEIQTVFVELGLGGNYSSLTSFLELLEKNLRLIDVFEINISQTGIPDEQIVLNFKIKANAYYLSIK